MATALTGQQALRYAFDRLGGTDERYRLLDAAEPVLDQVPRIFGGDATAAILDLIQDTAITFDHRTYATIPILRPYSIRARGMRGGGKKVENWGTPREDGYFSDDNSLLKRLPTGLRIQSADPRIEGRKITGGWTACHAWRALDDRKQASGYGLLNSFVPVLAWVPSQLSRPNSVEHASGREVKPDYFAFPE